MAAEVMQMQFTDNYTAKLLTKNLIYWNSLLFVANEIHSMQTR